jgi:hypothetical protein
MIALARPSAQPRSVEHPDTAATVTDQAGSLQLMRSFRNSLASCTQHRGHGALQHHELAASGVVPEGKQPARQTLLDRVMLTAGDRLADHREKRSGIGQQETLQRSADSQFVPKILCAHPYGGSGELHNGLVGTGGTGQENIDPHHSFTTDGADFDRALVIQSVDHRHHRIFGEVHRFDFPIGAVQKIAASQFDSLEFRQQAFVIVEGQARQNDVLGTEVDVWGSAPFR